MNNREYVALMQSRGVKTIEHSMGIDPDEVVRLFQSMKKLGQVGEDGRLAIGTRASTPNKNEYGIVVKPEAFLGTMARFREFPVMLAYHDQSQPVGRWTEDEISTEGLYLGGYVSSGAPHIQRLVLDDVITASSIAFWPKKEEWNEETKTLTILEMDLLECSLVPVPADRGTYIEMLSGLGFAAWAARYKGEEEPAPTVLSAPDPWRNELLTEVAAASIQLAAMMKSAPWVNIAQD